MARLNDYHLRFCKLYREVTIVLMLSFRTSSHIELTTYAPTGPSVRQRRDVTSLVTEVQELP